MSTLYRGALALVLMGSSVLAQAQSGGADVYVPGGVRAQQVKPLLPGKGGSVAARVNAIPVAYDRTSQILLSSYGDTQLAVPLTATDTDAGSSIVSYTVTALPPAASGVLRLAGVAITTTTVISAANAGNLTFDPAPTFFGTAVFQYTAKDNTGSNSTAVTYGIPVAKATCGAGAGQANNLAFYSRTVGEDWKVTRTVTVGGVTVTANPAGSPYTSSAGVNTLEIDDQPALPGKGLVWSEDYTSNAVATATVTFTFSRAVANFTLTAGDLDTGTGYIDQLIIQGYDASNNLVTIPAANASTGTSNSYSTSAGSNTFTGTGTNGGLASNNVLATFPSAITRLVLTYRNRTTDANPAFQFILFPTFAWCAQADIQSTLTGPTRAQAGSTVSLTATTRNLGTDAVNTVVPTVQLPTGLTGVTGGSYVPATGVLTLPTISNLASGAAVVNTITYTMPAAVAVTATLSFTSTADDPTNANNTASVTTAQNRVPVANDVTSSPAILSSTVSQTNIASFNASDPDASAGNTTITSYTITSLPTAAQGTLYVNGVAATLNQVITVPTTATPAVPGYQLSFVPNGTFSGNASFTYKATDDTGTSSNVANYFIPVTAGADLVSTVSGSNTGVEGQSKTYSVTTTNNGPATATNVVPTITLSNKPPFSSVSVTNGSYDPVSGVVTFNPIASLASGASVVNSLTLVVQPTPPSFTVTAANTSATADPTPANNNGTAPAATLTVAIASIGPAGIASACATPGRDGSPNISANPNTYYPSTASQTVAVNATSFSVGAATGTTLTPIAIGDLLLVIQMQGADIDFSNSDSYGDGVAGGFATSNLSNANFTAGQYEYVVAAAAVPVGGGSVTITTGLKNSYQNAAATATTGQRRFQVVRIPQYQNLTVSGTVSPSAWNGSSGGILALDVSGRLTFAAGAKLDASGLGFRGGAGQKLNGTTGVTGTDYRAPAPATGSTTVGAHAMKGEGTVGTPRYVNDGAALLDTGTDGYPSGSSGRGAPGNAGGGGTDASPTPAGSGNTQNSGGGGGGNGSRGGRGGNSAISNAAVGGEPGGVFNPPSSSRLILGGGGGAGVSNDGSGGGPNLGYASSGTAGGGIVLVRTGSVAGAGSILANGASASSTVVNDGSGGGGAGGSILVTASNTASLSSLNLAANGGNGGSNSAATAQGPGGGGGGGIILSNAMPSSASVAGGSNGTTTGSVAYGASTGLPGIANTTISPSIANSTAGISCSTDVTATISGPSSAATGQTVNLSAVFANNGGVDALNVSRTVVLASGDPLNPVTGVVAPGSTSISAPAPGTGDVTITYAAVSPLAAGSSSSFGISYTAPGSAAITATASITTTSPEPVTSNNTSVATTTITGFADVVSALSGLTSSTTGRATATYAVVFANNGPAAASNVTRTVTLPAGASLTTAQLNAITAQGGSYNAGTQVIDFGNLATLNSRGASVFQFSYTAPNAGGSTNIVSNITTTTAQDAGGGTGVAPDQFTFAVTNNPAADVATTSITPSAATVVPGQSASFTVNFVNNGPADAINALRYAQLTSGLSIVSITGGGSYDPVTGIVTYPNIPLLANGATAPSVITFLAPAAGPVNISGSIVTAAGSVSSGIFDNNQATASIAVTPIADVATTVSGPSTAVAGNLVTFGVTTTNNGPSPAAFVMQTIQLPTGLTGVFPTNYGSYNSSTGVVSFVPMALLASGQTVNNTVSFNMPGSAFTATAAVSTSTGEAAGTTANNSASAAPTAVIAATTTQANVYNTLDISDKNVAAGAPITFTIVTGNNGPNAALNVVQQLALPPNLSISSISNGGSYNAATGLVTFPALASLTSGTSVSNTVVALAPAAGPLVAIASVSSATSDPVPADNLTTRNVDIVNTADVATSLIGLGVAAANQVSYFTVSTVNNGPVPALNVVQTVTIPAGFAPSEVTTTGGGVYDPATGIITWPSVGSLAVGEVRTYTYSYLAPAFKSTDASNPRTIVSQAAVTSTTPDGNQANNKASLATEIKWNSDVSIAVAGPTTSIVGNPVTFTVSTTNNGPAPAASVTPTVRIATGLPSVVASGGGVYDINTGIVTFPTIVNQASGVSGAVTNTITVIVPDRPIIGVSAAANIPTATNDVNLTNNAANLIIPVTTRTTTLVDLQTTLSANLASQQAGQPIVLTALATNASATASNVRERVTLPAGLSNVVVKNFDGSTLAGAYDAASGAVTFPLVTNLAPGATLSYSITVNDPGSDPLVATASINGNFSDPTPANNDQTLSVIIVPVADVATRVSGPATILPGGLITYDVVTINNGPSPANNVVQTVQLPTGLSGVTVSGGGSYDAMTGRVTFPAITTQAVGKAGSVNNTISFTFPTTASTITGTVTSGTAENAGTTANNTSTLTTTLANQVPLANTVSNLLQSPIGNTAGQITLTAIKGLDPDGSLASFTITSVPVAGSGNLFLGGSVVGPGRVISLADAANLKYDPPTGFVGNAFFTYLVTDNLGAVSGSALYTIAVGLDNNAVYTNTPLKGGVNQYLNGDVIANVFDANGGAYNAAAAITDNGVRTASVGGGSLPAGVELDPVTGQIRVFNRSLLVAGTYPVTISTVDANGGITNQTIALRIGDFPLPVELTRFEAQAQSQDARLSWTTAQEVNNAGFQLERSVDGRRFEALAFVAGAGTSSLAHDYSFVDAGVGRQHRGKVYYRLQQRDLDGKLSYSPVRTVTFPASAESTPSVALFPNPAVAQTTLDLTQLPAAGYQVTVVDLAGRVVQAQTQAGGQTHTLEVGSLASGSYLVIIRNSSLKITQHLRKQ
jgi:uncharacterized repeat protein (TIGR01451 family)